MSERVLRAQVEQFHYRKTRSMQEELLRKNLFSARPEVCSRAYRCEITDDKAGVAVGCGVLLLPEDDDCSVKVVVAVTQVARICGETAVQLVELIKEAGGFIDATVIATGTISPSFEVRLNLEPPQSH